MKPHSPFKKLKIFFSLLFFCCFGQVFSQDELFQLWENEIPGAIAVENYKEESNQDAKGTIIGLKKVSTPTLSLFSPKNGKGNGTSVIIFPGGGYSHLSIEKEGNKIGRWLSELGITAFVLKYRLPSDEIMKDKSLAPLADAQKAVRTLRKHADKWDLDPKKIGIMGFSAGGHLAASLSTRFDEKTYREGENISARPDFSILVYPVISMSNSLTHKGSQERLLGATASPALLEAFSNERLVTASTPPTFLVHAADDHAVPVENSLEYFKALRKNKVPAELHIYEKGGHGFGMGKENTNQYWPEVLENWMQDRGYIEPEQGLIFSYFKGNGEDGLHLAFSEDAYTWKALNNDDPFLKPELGKEKLMRDPCIIKGGDGKYHMVWTVGWTEKGIGYASSKDLIHWSEQWYIPVMEHEEGARNTWAPEITYDEDNEEYMIYWATTIEGEFPETQSDKDSGYNHRMYYTTTKNFKDFSPTKLLYEPGFNVIDATIQKEEDTYVMFLKDETREPAQKNIRVAFGESLTGPYGEASEPITGDYWAEGPTATKIAGEWIVYFDKYIEKEFGAVKSKNLETWQDISKKISFPQGTRHGSVLKVKPEVLRKLKKQG